MQFSFANSSSINQHHEQNEQKYFDRFFVQIDFLLSMPHYVFCSLVLMTVLQLTAVLKMMTMVMVLVVMIIMMGSIIVAKPVVVDNLNI